MSLVDVSSSINSHHSSVISTQRLTQGSCSRGASMNSSRSSWFASRWRTMAPFLYLPPRRRVSLRELYILPNDTGPDATTPDGLSNPFGSSFDRWIATPAPFLRAWDANRQEASIPLGPSISFSTTKTVQLTGNRPDGSSIQLCTRPVRLINSDINNIFKVRGFVVWTFQDLAVITANRFTV